MSDQPPPNRPSRPFKPRRPGGPPPWKKREGPGAGGPPPWKKRDDRPGGGGPPPWKKRDDRPGGGGPPPWKKRDDRPGGGGPPPWKKRDDGPGAGGPPPWKKRDDRPGGGGPPPWKKRDDRPGGGGPPPWKKREGAGGPPPWKKRDDRPRPPWKNRPTPPPAAPPIAAAASEAPQAAPEATAPAEAPQAVPTPAAAPASAWKPRPKRDTSWQGASRFYDDSVGEAGHFYHQTVVLPGVMRMLRLGETECVKLLDLACGQGVLARTLPVTVEYWGVDLSEDLLAAARKHDARPTRRYVHGDACGPLPFDDADFTHAACVLALQNVERPEALIAAAAAHLAPGGRLVLAMNHPCFRIPKQSSWGEDMRARIRYRRMDRYLSRQRIAIKMNPSLGEASPETWSFHAPLSDIFGWFRSAGLFVEHLEEWVSNKKSAGPASVMENRARAEFPLFLCLSAVKPR